MATSKSGNKSVKQAATKRVFNMRRLRDMREQVKSVETLAHDKKGKEAQEALATAYKAIDKAAKRGVIKKNTAARKKSVLAKKVANA